MVSLDYKIKRIREILNTEYYPVGIKILKDTISQWNKSFQDVSKDKRFCFYVRQAAVKGNKYIIKKESVLECHTPFLCLGFKEPKYVDFDTCIKPANTKIVLIGPVNKIETQIDSIIFVVNPRQAMILTNALQRFLKKKIDANFGASMAVCGEIVAFTIIKQAPNLSVLCEGARTFSNYTDDELVFGVPFQFFDSLYTNLERIDKLKEIIERKKSRSD
ncbi:MAG: DUF169 domain-containing protein [Promethearchaeota archaeon]